MKKRIAVDPRVHFGKPCVTGTRIPVQSVLELVREGLTFSEVIGDYYPDLQPEDIRACIQYAIDDANLPLIQGALSEPMPKRSSYQQRVIRNYYQNRDAIALQKLGEMVTDLYLAEGKARDRLWQRVAAALEKLKVSKKRIDHLVASDNPTLVANLVKELLAAG